MIIKDYDKRSRGLYFSLDTATAEKLNKIFVVKMSDFVFTLIKLASVTFFPASPLIRTPIRRINTDTINGFHCIAFV